MGYLPCEDDPGQGIDRVVDTLAPGAGSLETLLAIGRSLRRDGEVEQAIYIHNRLLAQDGLTPAQYEQARLELARDYQKAGLHDQAEQLFGALERGSPGLRLEALQDLVDLYDEEHSWEQALDAGARLLRLQAGRGGLSWLRRRPPPQGGDGQQLVRRLAHYCCELAQLELEAGQHQGADRYLGRALQFDPGCGRARLLQARSYLAQGQTAAATEALEHLGLDSPRFMELALPLLEACFEGETGPAGLRQYLQDFLSDHVSLPVTVFVAQSMCSDGEPQRALQFLQEQFERHPNLASLPLLLALLNDEPQELSPGVQAGLQDLIEALGGGSAGYRCEDCGYGGRHLHWRCPSCRHWGSIAPAAGLGVAV